MSDQLELADREPILRPARHHGRAPRLIVLGLLATLIAGAITVVVRGESRTGPAGARPAVTATAGTATARRGAIERLLRRRSAAVVDHDRAAFLATVDPAEAGFWHQQRNMFANLAGLSFASWSYRMGSAQAHQRASQAARYDAPTWAPEHFALRYRIAGFDPSPTDLPQYPTFVERSGRWYLGSLSDFLPRGEISATDLWDYAPVRIVRRPSVLVLGPPARLATMTQVANQTQAAIPRVTAIWGRHWAQRVVIQVPATEREMRRIDGGRGNLDRIVALTSAEASRARGRPTPVGDRITINPRNWPKVGPAGAAVVLTHELTHVASRADTGAQTPKWLAEGFADYVGFRDSGLPVATVAAELAAQLRVNGVPKRLPTNAGFAGGATHLPQAYELSWLVCRDIAARYGQPALVRFYRSVGTSQHRTSLAVNDALHHVLGLSLARFTASWRGYVRRQLA